MIPVPANGGDLVLDGVCRFFLADHPAVIAELIFEEVEDRRDVADPFAERLPVVARIGVLEMNVGDAPSESTERIEQVLSSPDDMPRGRIAADRLPVRRLPAL